MLIMQGANRERWRKLCDEAATEQDPERLLHLYKEILQMLDEKAARLFSAYVSQQSYVDRAGTKPN